MNREYINYPSTKHFKESFLSLSQIGKVKLHGNIKLHGTNFSLIVDPKTFDWYFQNRNNVVEYYNNFYGFNEVFGVGNKERTGNLKGFISSLVSQIENRSQLKKVMICGELIGEGIQKKVALEKLTRRFVVFAIKLVSKEDEVTWIRGNDLKVLFNSAFQYPDIYCIENFKTWDLEADINDPVQRLELQNKLQEITEEVEKECPFAKEFGVSGIGEGVVWQAQNGIVFKVKGDEHSTSKVRTLNKVELDKIAQLKNLMDIAPVICTNARLEQGVRYLNDNNITDKKFNHFLKWIIEDTLKEESDFIQEKGFSNKEIAQALYNVVVKYFNENKELF